MTRLEALARFWSGHGANLGVHQALEEVLVRVHLIQQDGKAIHIRCWRHMAIPKHLCHNSCWCRQFSSLQQSIDSNVEYNFIDKQMSM